MLWLYLAVIHITLWLCVKKIPCHQHRRSSVLELILTWTGTSAIVWERLRNQSIDGPLALDAIYTLSFLTNCYIFYHHTAIFIHHPYLQPAVLTHHQNVDHVISSLTSSSLSWLPGRACRAWLQDQPIWSGQLRSMPHHKAAKWHLLHSPAAPSSWDLHPLPLEKPECCYRLRNPILLGQYCWHTEE